MPLFTTTIIILQLTILIYQQKVVIILWQGQQSAITSNYNKQQRLYINSQTKHAMQTKINNLPLPASLSTICIAIHSICQQNIPLPAVVGRIVVWPLLHTIKLQPHLYLMALFAISQSLVESIEKNSSGCWTLFVNDLFDNLVALPQSRSSLFVVRPTSLSHNKITASALQNHQLLLVQFVILLYSSQVLGYVNPY